MYKPVVLALMIAACTVPQPAHAWVEDFETTTPGTLPAGWEVFTASRDEGWAAGVATKNAAAGNQCVGLSLADPTRHRGMGTGGSAYCTFDATPFRGKTMRLAAQLRYAKDERLNGWVQIRVLARRRGGVVLAHQNSGDRPVSTPEWASRVIALEIPSDADTLEVGLTVAGAGAAWLDTVEFNESSLVLSQWNAPPSPLSERGLENLVALARLYGYVRFFHPSDEAFATHWGDFLLAAIDRVEPASNPAELRERLREVFAPIAPALELAASSFDAPADADKLMPPSGSEHDYVLWKHQGYGVEQLQGTYKSRRLASQGLRSLLDQELRDAPKPGTTARGDLCDGVCFRLPTVLYTQDGKTWPAGTGSIARLDAPEEWSANGADRRTRLAGVMVAWNVFQHFYPYFDVVPVDWSAALREALAAAALDADRDAFLGTLRRLTARTRDGHVRVSHGLDNRPYALPLDWDWAADVLVVTRVAESNGAGAPRRGDVVESLNGQALTEWVARERAEIAAASEGWMRWRLRDQLLRWPSADPVQIGVRDAEGKRRTVALVPVRIEWKSRLRETRPANGDEVAPGIVYFDLDGAEVVDLEKAMPKLSAARGVVIDLRGYPGGAGSRILEHLAHESMTSAYWNVAHCFMPDRRDVQFVTGGRWNLKPREPRIPAGGGRAVFITDGSAISYAESCMGIVEAYDLATIVGAPTAATNGNVAGIRLPGGFRVSFTGMQVLKHDGTTHHGVGIRPTVPVERTRSGIAAGRDELLERAIEIARLP